MRAGGYLVLVFAVAVGGASCLFSTKTNLCEQYDIRCESGQTCARDQPVCVNIAGCGDGHMDPGEVCDDGNILAGDGCSADCASLEKCGNGIVDMAVGEACDGEAGCSTDCHFQRCGNKLPDEGEGCDAGAIDTEDCTYMCTISRCGDGYVNDQAHEECEPAMNADCNDRCKWRVCGDGAYDERTEQCDTGGNTQACNGNDHAMSGGAGDCQIPSCGDSYVNDQFKPFHADEPESCDDGGDSPTCNGSTMSGPGSCRTPTCGDSHVNAKFKPDGVHVEQCDTGGIDTPECNGKGKVAKASCRLAICGDGYTNKAAMVDDRNGSGKHAEQCDGGVLGPDGKAKDTASCNFDCTEAKCYDEYYNSEAEECEPGKHGCAVGSHCMDCKCIPDA